MVEAARESLRIERVGDAHVRVAGVLGFSEAAAANDRVRELVDVGGSGAIDVDVAGLRQVDSASLAVLLSWAAHAARKGRPLRFHGVAQDLRALAHLCDAEPLLGLN